MPLASSWRVLILFPRAYVGIATLGLKESGKGPNLVTDPARISASTVFSADLTASKAIEGVPGFWSANDTDVEQWLRYNFPTPRDIKILEITSRGDGSHASFSPEYFFLQYSTNNGTSWTSTTANFYDARNWQANQKRSFPFVANGVASNRAKRVQAVQAAFLSGEAEQASRRHVAPALVNGPDVPSPSGGDETFVLIVT